MPVEIDVISVDQLTYDEVIRSMSRAVQVFILEMQPLPGQVLLGFGLDITTSIIDRLLGGPGHASTRHRELSHVEQLLIRKMVERGLQNLEEAWHNLIQLSINIIGMEESYTLIQIAPPSEIVALITFEIHLGNHESGLFNLCIPFPVLEDVMNKLSNQHMFQNQTGQVNYIDQLKILSRLESSMVAFNVLLGASTITVQELVQLQAGDVIRLNSTIHQDMVACINGQPKFLCQPGIQKKQLAVSIEESIEVVDQVVGFGSLAKDVNSYDVAG
jgi:flagellar motor switch protein FliM